MKISESVRGYFLEQWSRLNFKKMHITDEILYNKCFHLLKERLAFCGRRPRADKIHVNSSSAEKSAKRPQFFSVCSSSVSESDWEGRVCAYPRLSNYKNLIEKKKKNALAYSIYVPPTFLPFSTSVLYINKHTYVQVDVYITSTPVFRHDGSEIRPRFTQFLLP